VSLIANLAQTLKLRVVAEGVESVEQAHYIRQSYPQMCQQGYFHGKPVSMRHWLHCRQLL